MIYNNLTGLAAGRLFLLYIMYISYRADAVICTRQNDRITGENRPFRTYAHIYIL